MAHPFPGICNKAVEEKMYFRTHLERVITDEDLFLVSRSSMANEHLAGRTLSDAYFLC